MKILGYYLDKGYRSLQMNYRSRVALEISSAWTEGYSGKEDDTDFYVVIRSECYVFHIMKKENKYLDKNTADKLIQDIATNNLIDLDNYDLALYAAVDTTPDE